MCTGSNELLEINIMYHEAQFVLFSFRCRQIPRAVGDTLELSDNLLLL